MSSPSSAASLLRLLSPCPHLAATAPAVGCPSTLFTAASAPAPRLHRASPRRRRDPPLRLLPPGAAGRANRLYACLVCASISCHAHAPNHAALRPGHEIALDVDCAELFYAVCCDQVYDPDFDAAIVIAHTSLSSSRHLPPPVEKQTKRRRRVEYRPWSPDLKEGAAIGRKSSLLLVQEGNASSASSATTMGGGGQGETFFFFALPVAWPLWPMWPGRDGRERGGKHFFFCPSCGLATMARSRPATTGRDRGKRREGEGVGGRNKFFFCPFRGLAGELEHGLGWGEHGHGPGRGRQDGRGGGEGMGTYPKIGVAG